MPTAQTRFYCPECIGMGFIFTIDDDEDCPRNVMSCLFDGCTCEAPCPVCSGAGYVLEEEVWLESNWN
jgi:hypothetical protein